MPENPLKPVPSKFARYAKAYGAPWQGKRVAMWGNFGHGDLGDDTAYWVARQYFGKDLLPVSKALEAFNPAKYRALIISGGGTLRWESPYLPRRIFDRSKWPFPIVLCALGTNRDLDSQYSLDTLEKTKRLCQMADLITVRDFRTQQFLKRLGFSETRLLPHLEFGVVAESYAMPFEKRRKTVGIVLTPHPAFEEEVFTQISGAMTAFIRDLIDGNKDVVLIPFEQEDSADQRETELIQEIVRSVAAPEAVHVLPANLTGGQILSAMQQSCDLMLCMRMHSMAFAANAGVPFFCIPYNEMHLGLLEVLEMEEWQIPLSRAFESGALSRKFGQLEGEDKKVRTHLEKKRTGLLQQVQDQLSYIQSFIKDF